MIGRQAPLAGSLTATTVTALAVVGLGVVAPSTAAEGDPPTVKVAVSGKHVVSMADELQPGVHRFVVRSKKAASFQMLRAAKGYTKKEATRDANRMFESPRALKRFERNVTLAGGVSSRPDEPGVMWADLEKGRYWAVDTGPEVMEPGHIAVFRVRGESLGGTLPGYAELTAVSEHAWSDDPEVIPESGELLLTNASDANHMYGLAKLKDGKTIEDFETWIEKLKKGKETPSPVSFAVGTESGVVGPGRSMSLKYDLPEGDYVLVCFWPDAGMDNMPHVFMGMYRAVRVKTLPA